MINFNSMPYKDESFLRYVTIVKSSVTLRLCVSASLRLCVSASKKGISTVVDVRIGELKELVRLDFERTRIPEHQVPRTSKAGVF